MLSQLVFIALLAQDEETPAVRAQRADRATAYLYLGTLILELSTDQRVHRGLRRVAKTLLRPFKKKQGEPNKC